jgi:hypothetical protein
MAPAVSLWRIYHDDMVAVREAQSPDFKSQICALRAFAEKIRRRLATPGAS